MIFEAHKKYGNTVRLAPDELSFTQAQAWKDIYSHTPGKEEFPKDPAFHVTPPNGIPNILGANKENHARYRRLLAHAFSEKGLRDQESHIRHYIDLLMDRLAEKAKSGETTDMVVWYNMTVFDVIGDLAWGESFDCLENRELHEWIPAISGSVKFVTQSTIARRRGLNFLTPYLVDKETQALRVRNYKYSQEKVEARVESDENRGDFWDRIMIKSANDNETGEGMTKDEMLNNAAILVLGGSETSATTLSGATYLLLKTPRVMKKLVNEIRSTFNSADEITPFSVNKLPYALAVLEETMRIYPSVPRQGARITPKGGGVVCGGFVPENVSCPVQYHIHVSPVLYLTSTRSPSRHISFQPLTWKATFTDLGTSSQNDGWKMPHKSLHRMIRLLSSPFL